MRISQIVCCALIVLLGFQKSYGQVVKDTDVRTVSIGYVLSDLFIYNYNFQLEWKPTKGPYSILGFYGSGIRPNFFSQNQVDINKQRVELGLRRYFPARNESQHYFLQTSIQWVDGRAYYDDVRKVLVENQNGQRYYTDYEFRNTYDFNQYGVNLGAGVRDETKYYYLDMLLSVGYRYKSEFNEDVEQDVNYFGSSGYEGVTFRFAATFGFKYDY